MVKFIGALFVLFAGTMIGFQQAAKFAERPKQLRQLVHMLQRLITEIGYGHTLLPEALKRAASTAKGPIAIMFTEAANGLLESSELSFEEHWKAAIKKYWSHTSMRSNEQAVLYRLGTSLGISDTEDQIKNLQLAIDQIKLEDQAAREEQGRYEAMWKSLGVLTAVLIIILMM